MTSPKERPYYVLFVREDRCVWTMEFGDYDRDCVLSERDDWLDHYDDQDRKRRKKDTLVLKLRTADQWRIDAILAGLAAFEGETLPKINF